MDGSIEYIGRDDNQLKIRGYRIELGEVENILLQIEGIKQSCVLTKERKNEAGSTKHLVAYYVLDSKDDGPSRFYIRKMETLRHEKLPEKWFGEVSMDEK